MQLHLTRVSVFVKVVQEGGFSAASRALGLPKSSVSRAVALLEQELGAQLLRRSTRSIALTDAGAAFYGRASHGLAAIDEAREAVVELETEVRGTVRITAAVDAGVWLLSSLLAGFIERHPGVVVDVVLTARTVDLVEEGFDLAVRMGPVHDERLIARRIPSLDLGVYASPAYLARHGHPARVSDLESHRCVVFRGPGGRATWTLSGPDGTEHVAVSGAVNTDDFAFALQSVVAGAGLGLLPCFVAEHGGHGQVTRVLPHHRSIGAPAHIVVPAGRYLPRRVALLADFLVEGLAPANAPTKRRRIRRAPRRGAVD